MAQRRTRGLDTSKAPSETQEVLAAIRKRFGERSIGSGREVRQPFRIPTGIFTLDYATLGGVPFNRFTLLRGAKHSGKTTGSNRIIAGAQQSMPDKQAVLVDVEGTFDATWAEKTGVDVDNLLVSAPETGEEAIDVAVGLAQSREVSLIVIDSLAALLPHKEEEMSAEDASIPGLQAKLITIMLRKLNGALIKERKRDHFISIVLINQQRSKIGGWSPTGDPISEPGGKAVGHFTSLEIKFKNKEVSGKDAHGFDALSHNEHAFQIDKNKMNAGMRDGEFRVLRQADESTGLTEGSVDNVPTMLAFAKRLGWWGGAGQGQYLEFADFSQKFKNVGEGIQFLNEDTDTAWLLRQHLIADNARRQGMPQDFIDYLLS